MIEKEPNVKEKLSPNEITNAIIRAAMKVHSTLGPGLLESAYRTCLAYELRRSGFEVLCELTLPIVYEGVKLDAGYRIDMLVNDTVIVELKATDTMLAVYSAQLLSYLRLCGKQLGLLINFKVPHLREGIKRVVNDFKDSSAPSASSALKGVQ